MDEIMVPLHKSGCCFSVGSCVFTEAQVKIGSGACVIALRL